MKHFITLLLFALFAASCSHKKENAIPENPTKSDFLVLYYSQEGATEQLAHEIQQQLGADIEALTVTKPYDGDLDQTIERCQQEMKAGEIPELNKLQTNIDDYDIIFIGYPVWFGTYAPPVAALLEKYNFAGKKIIPFCTFGSGGLNTSTEQLKKALPQAEILPGYGIRNARIRKCSQEVTDFLIASHFIEGEPTELPDYSPQTRVTAHEKDIFHTACDDYPMLHATPLTYGMRKTPTGTDYLFTAEDEGRNGKTVIQVKITVDNAQGGIPEFTEVLR